MRRIRTYMSTGAATLAMACTLGLLACGGSDSDDDSAKAPTSRKSALEDKLAITNSGGELGDIIQGAFVEPFEQTSGVDVQYVPSEDDQSAMIRAQEQAGQVEIDLAGGYYYSLYAPMYKQGLLEKIDYTKVGPGADKLNPGAKQEWGIGYGYSGFPLAYNSSKYPDPPTKLADFFDVERFPGKRGVSNWGQPEVNIALALIADGVTPADLTPFDYDRAFAQLDRVKSSISLYYTSGSDSVSALVDGQVSMCLCTDGRTLEAQALEPDIALAWDGGLAAMVYWVMLKGAPHPEAAHAWLKSQIDPAQSAEYTDKSYYSGTVPGADTQVDPKIRDAVLANPENRSKVFEFTPQQQAWMTDNAADVNERWNEWLTK